MKVFVPVALLIARVPLVPAPTVVVPVTPKAKPPAVNVVPSPIPRFPAIARAALVVRVDVPLKLTLPATEVIGEVALALPLKVRFPPIVVTPVKVFAPEPERVRLPR